MTQYVEELLVEALLAAPGCPEPLVERYLREAATDFYRETNAWRFTTEPSSVMAGFREVELELPSNTRVARVYWAKLAGEKLEAKPLHTLKDRRGTPQAFAIDGVSTTLQLDVLPERSYIMDGLVAHVALQPLRTLNDLPDELFDLHRDGILYGAIAKLLAMPNVAWGSLQDAGTYGGLARAIRGEAQRQANALQAPVVRVVRYGGI